MTALFSTNQRPRGWENETQDFGNDYEKILKLTDVEIGNLAVIKSLLSTFQNCPNPFNIYCPRIIRHILKILHILKVCLNILEHNVLKG